jgi:hypothetical protein
MPSYREPDPSDLEKSREARIARQNLVRHEQYVSALRRAERLRSDSGRPASSELTELISSGTTELNAVKQRAGGRIYPRRRPTNKHPTSYPYLWPEFRGKLCQGHETKNSILGLKIMPWRERYKDLWKS